MRTGKAAYNIISLGAGVQSSTLALLAARGVLTPMPDAAIFADTRWEPKSVYAWLDWLETQLPFPVIRADKGDLGADGKEIKTSKAGHTRMNVLVPLFTKRTVVDQGILGPIENTAHGVLPRSCTRDYKIRPILRAVKNFIGAPAIWRNPPEGVVSQWIGISLDEWMRGKPAREPWVVNRFPLVDELRWTRADCLRWWSENNLPTPPRSACVFCPYHTDAEWLRLKKEEPEEFQRAVEWERSYQEQAALVPQLRSTHFMHRSCVPIDQVVLKGDSAEPDHFGNECEGMCGN